MLLSNSLSLLASDNDTLPLRGSNHKSDTTIAKIPISLIRKANIKMIERIYLLDINKQQDSIIIMKDKYINEQKKIIVDFQNRVNEANKLNQVVNNSLEKEKRKNNIITGASVSIIVTLLISLIIK